MKRPRKLLPAAALLGTMLLGLCAVCTAQVTATATVKLKQPKVKIDSFKGAVVNCTPVAITVRSANDANKIRTFSFTPELTRKMENHHLDNGAKVNVKYRHMSDTAVALKGKIRK